MKVGKFIVFEGIDGVGKTTQVGLLALSLFSAKKDNNILITREPTNRHQEIRREIQSEHPSRSPQWFADVFTQDRKEHVETQILPALKQGCHVICDRYYHSTLVYQSTQGLDLKELWKQQQDFPQPDLTIILDCPIDEIKERKRGELDRFDKDEIFQQQLREGYKKLVPFLQEKGHRIEIVETTGDSFSTMKKILDGI